MSEFSLALVERQTILRALDHFGSNVPAAMSALGVSRDKFYRKLRQHYIPAPTMTPVRTTGALLPSIEQRRALDLARASRLALRRVYYQFLRETQRVASVAVGIEAKVKELLADIERFGVDANHPLVPKVRAALARLETPLVSLPKGAGC